MSNRPCVGIIMGSDSDLSIMKEVAIALDMFSISYEFAVLSAHRTPEAVLEYALSSADKFDVIVAGAGASAHLPGVIAAHTLLPVIGVPISSTSLLGLDSLCSIVQMPAGVPVATMAIGKAGARNAGIYAAQIISLGYKDIKGKLNAFRKDMRSVVIEKNAKINKIGWKEYLAQRD